MEPAGHRGARIGHRARQGRAGVDVRCVQTHDRLTVGAGRDQRARGCIDAVVAVEDDHSRVAACRLNPAEIAVRSVRPVEDRRERCSDVLRQGAPVGQPMASPPSADGGGLNARLARATRCPRPRNSSPLARLVNHPPDSCASASSVEVQGDEHSALGPLRRHERRGGSTTTHRHAGDTRWLFSA